MTSTGTEDVLTKFFNTDLIKSPGPYKCCTPPYLSCIECTMLVTNAKRYTCTTMTVVAIFVFVAVTALVFVPHPSILCMTAVDVAHVLKG